MKNAVASLTLLVLTCLSNYSFALLFEYEHINGVLGHGGDNGSFDSLYTSYDDSSQQLTWLVDNAMVGQQSGSGQEQMDGFWLVLDNGPNPKSSDVNELAIFYADFNSDTLLAFAYNGQNNANSINNPGIFIGDFSSDIIKSGSTLGFSLDASSINSFMHPDIVASNWQGAQYDNSIGIWFHASNDTSITGNHNDGYNFNFDDQNWYDKSNRTTHVVPEPDTLVLFAIGLIGLIVSRKQNTPKASAL